MKRLYLLRHAKAEQEGKEDADFKRELNRKGLVQANVVGHLMKEKAHQIDKVFCSSASRTKMTFDIVKPHLFIDSDKIHYEERLYLASAETLLSHVRAHGKEASSVLLVGHNFGISELLSNLINEAQTMKTSDLAVIDFEVDEWEAIAEGSGILSDYITTAVHF